MNVTQSRASNLVAVTMILKARVCAVGCLLGFLLLQTSSAQEPSPYGGSSARTHVRITGVLLEPYLMEIANPGSIKYMGFIPDLLDELAAMLDFSYELSHVRDSSYGYRAPDGSWDGMIGELLANNSDLGAAPIYKTPQRARVVDFTGNFLDVQATLLLRKSYIHNAPVTPNIHYFLNHSRLQFGTLDRGVIIRSFRTTSSELMKKLWRRILWDKDSVLTETNKEGVERVRRGGYAFILPTAIGDYVAQQPPCDLVSVGSFLMDRGYSLVVRRGYNGVSMQDINTGLQTLRDVGKIDTLYRRWWYDESACEAGPSARGYRQSRGYSEAAAEAAGLSMVQSCHLTAVSMLLVWVLSTW